jgi:molybdopterin-biosynthesis enzyme MoeA-like protein
MGGAIELNEARLRMAHVPEGATLIDNPVSAAPGFRIDNVFVMAGVPAIAQAMFDGIKPLLAGGRRLLSRTLTCGLAEGTLAGDLGEVQLRHPALDIGSYPFWSRTGFGVSLVLRGTEAEELAAAAAEVAGMIRRLGGEPVDSEAD